MPQTDITLAFGDGEYRFKLGLSQIAAVEDKCGPIGEVFSRLLKGRYLVNGQPVGSTAEAAFKVADVIEVCRQALIGGGTGLIDGQTVKVDPLKANSLVSIYVADRPLAEGWSLAVAVMTAMMEGYTPPKEQAGNRPATKKKAPSA